MRQIIIAVVVYVALNLVVPNAWERFMTTAPDWALRLVLCVFAIGCAAAVFFSSPVYERVTQPNDYPITSTIAIASLAAAVFGAVWWFELASRPSVSPASSPAVQSFSVPSTSIQPVALSAPSEPPLSVPSRPAPPNVSEPSNRVAGVKEGRGLHPGDVTLAWSNQYPWRITVSNRRADVALAHVTLSIVNIKERKDGIYKDTEQWFPMDEVTLSSDGGANNVFGNSALPFNVISEYAEDTELRTIRFAGRKIEEKGEWEVTFKCQWDGQASALLNTFRFAWNPGQLPRILP
jgi:hypothetical protein